MKVKNMKSKLIMIIKMQIIIKTKINMKSKLIMIIKMQIIMKVKNMKLKINMRIKI